MTTENQLPSKMLQIPLDRADYVPPKRLIRSHWMRADWIRSHTTPVFRFHVVLGGGNALWLKIGRLDLAFHRYV